MKNKGSSNIFAEYEKIKGIVCKIVFRSDDTGYTVASIEKEDCLDVITVVGKMVSIKEGETGEFIGKWIHNKKYGRQFQVENYRELRPSTLEGVRKYLSSGMVKGIGPELARRLVDKFGTDTLDVIDYEPCRLKEVEGIGKKRVDMILSAWSAQKGIREIIVFLQSQGIGPSRAVKVYKTYGRNTIKKIKENPYALSEDIWGIGFKLADDIAQKIGFSKESPQRARAAILHSLKDATKEGHCYLPLSNLKDNCISKLGVPADSFEEALDTLLQKGNLKKEEDNIYLFIYHFFEENIAYYIKRILNTPPSCFPIDSKRAIDLIGGDFFFKPTLGQIEAINSGLKKKISIITGGPGVGKTTILKALVSILNKMGVSVILCAPTGRAAKRMTESIGIEAKTIHRTLEYKPKEGEFSFNSSKPINCDYMIVDEMSMVDTSLFYHLLSALNPGASIVMVGDVDQLSSVGAGQVLKDLINSRKIPTIYLNEVHRQKEGSLIIQNAHKINEGYFPFIPTIKSKSQPLLDFYFIECNSSEEMREKLIKSVTKRIPRRFYLDPVRDIQVLTPMLKGEMGVNNLNFELQKALNPNSEIYRGYYLNDKVMQVRNNYDKEVFNGDIGFIADFDRKMERILVNFGGRRIEYDVSEIDEIKKAYACTIHKSQGSEFPAVVIPLYTGHFIMLRRNLLYTAITRAKKLVVLIGSRKALKIAVTNNKENKRYTGLKEKIINIF